MAFNHSLYISFKNDYFLVTLIGFVVCESYTSSKYYRMLMFNSFFIIILSHQQN